MSNRVVLLPSLQELEESLGSSLLKQTHERTLDSLHLRTGNLGDLAIAVDEAPSDLLELKVACHVRMHQDFGELSRSNDKLRDEINGVVAISAKLGRRGLVWSEFAIQLVFCQCPLL